MIYLIGIGTGNLKLLTKEAEEAINSSEIIIASKRILKEIPEEVSAKRYAEVSAAKIEAIIDDNSDKNISVLFSGDSGFYSGCKKLAEIYKEKAVVLPGIGSLSYMASKIKRPWQDVKLVSAHGILQDTNAYISSNKEVFFLTGSDITAETIIKRAYENGLEDTFFYVGENLSYDDERVVSGSASQLIDVKFKPLTVVWCVNNSFKEKKLHSFDMKDEEFIKENVPITKRQVRNAAILELQLKESGVFYDIGGGTGSLSVAVSKASPFIDIYTIEKKQNACDVISENFKNHNVLNGHIVSGTAPLALNDLPAPDYAFIGGSSGNLEEILNVILDKNPKVRVVITALTLETIVDIKEAFTNLGIVNWNGFQISVSDFKALGSYNALMAQNPIFMFSFGGEDES